VEARAGQCLARYEEVAGLDGKTREVFTVFLASPGDLEPERQKAREARDRLNRGLAGQLGLFVELICWEETGPSSGPPQDALNPDVDRCHLFVGLLWESWGEPTREYTSGFEEEYSRADKRRQESGAPDIWLYFKEIDDRRVNDPGPQLKKVVQFRQEREQSKDHFFREFGDENQFAEIFYDRLIQYLMGKKGTGAPAVRGEALAVQKPESLGPQREPP